ARAGVRLALVAALQYLPGRARAVLILRDVLGWRAAETAEVLGISAAAANSLLQRARRRLAEAAPAEAALREPDPGRERDLLDRYAAAFEQADVAGLVRLLTDDAIMEMPPQPGWFAGREAIRRFLASRVLTAPGRCRGWDLSMLLRHVAESLGVLQEGLMSRRIALHPGPEDTAVTADPLGAFRARAARLLATSREHAPGLGTEGPERHGHPVHG